ncbi:MAG: putative oxidoreductase [Chlamydiae bacterium]|nr:putative oxidoreductase [Chlamydiota bacterium]
MKIPLIGLGTWGLWGAECERIVRLALEIGYCHIDTAFAYENHKQIAKAIRGFPREELFLTTKFALGQVTKTMTLSQVDDKRILKSLEKTCDKALKELGTDYLDALLIHWPNRERPIVEILAAMHRLADKGKIRYPGVSNYTIHHLQDAYDAGLSVPFNQVEFHPHLYQKELLDFCQSHGTQLIAYRPFGKGKLLGEEPLFAELGQKYGKSPAQIILRWIIQKKVPVIPKASSEDHLRENFTIEDFSLSEEEEKSIDLLDQQKRYTNPTWGDFKY